MPSPPYDFSSFTSTSQFKLLGGNIGQVPSFVTGAPSTAYQYGWIFQNFSSGQNTWANWIKPQIDGYHRLGCKHIRCILGGDYVILGNITNSAHNAAINTMIAYVRSLGMTISFALMAVALLSDIGSPSAATIWAVAKSVLDNCIVPNQDVVGWFEPANQESFTGADQIVEDGVCGMMRAGGYTCPIGVSPGRGPSMDFSNYTSANYDIGLLHSYFGSTGTGTGYYESMRSALYDTLTSANRPVIMEEGNVSFAGAPDYQERADCMEQMLMAAYGHPNVMGCLFWAIYSTIGGDWTFMTTPGSYNPQAYDPTTDWQYTKAAVVMALWGTPNRNLRCVGTLNGSQSITGTQTALNLNGDTPIQHQTVTNQSLGTRLLGTTNLSCVGTISFTGDPGATYRVAFGAFSFPAGIWTDLGHVDIIGSASGQALNFSGTLGANGWVPGVTVQRIAGPAVNGTVTACNVTISVGNAPALSAPVATPLVL